MRQQLTSIVGGVLGMAMIGISSAGAGGGQVIAEFELGDHPDGNAAVPFYGLRLDNIIAPGTATLSMDHFGDTRMEVLDDSGVLSMHISGTLWGGEISNHAYVNPNAYEIDFWYSLNVSDAGNGWIVNGFDTANTGTITNLDTQDVVTLYGKANTENLVFSMLANGYRLDGDDSSWVGHGWVTTHSDGTNSASGAQDWLFTATKVPAPSSTAVLGLVGLVSMRRRR